MSNKGYFAQRHSPLTTIHRGNARQLNPRCHYEIDHGRAFYTNPVVYRGTIYVTTTHLTIALDAETCALRWEHEWQFKGQRGWVVNRGVALKDGVVVRGTADGHLLALDAATGKQLWQREIADISTGETITMAPLIYDDLVIIGPAGSDLLIKGWIGAFRLRDGTPVWRFNTVPKRGDAEYESWQMKEGQEPAGGGIWTNLALDPARGELFVPVANPAPGLFGDIRQGANLYTNAMLVLDIKTGRLLWYRQMLPHDVHDWDLTQTSPLFTLSNNGNQTDYVAVAGKDGLLRVIDRQSGAEVYKRAVSTQKNTDEAPTPEGTHACPGILGGVQWNGAAFHPKQSMLFIPSVDWCGIFLKDNTYFAAPGRLSLGGTYQPDPIGTAKGWLTALDAATGGLRWRYQSERPMLAAVTTTASDLVIAGTMTGKLLIFDASGGEKLYEHDIGDPLAGGIVTYEYNNTQFIAAVSGNMTAFWRARPGTWAKITIFGLKPGAAN